MLLRQYLRREAGGLLGWCLVIPAIVLPIVFIYPLMKNTESMAELNRMMEQLPPALRAIFGGSNPLASMNGWLLTQVFGFLVPLLLTVYTAMASLGVLTREMDGRTMDFLLSLPVRRTSVLLSRLAGLLLNLGALHGVLFVSLGVAVGLAGEQVEWKTYSLLLLNQYLIFAALTAVLVLVTVFLDDVQKGMLATLSVALVEYFLPHFIQRGTSFEGLARISLFYYANPREVLLNGALPGADVAVLLTVLVVGAGVAVLLFNRKQLSA